MMVLLVACVLYAHSLNKLIVVNDEWCAQDVRIVPYLAARRANFLNANTAQCDSSWNVTSVAEAETNAVCVCDIS